MPLPARFVERWYSLGAYPLLQRLLTSVSNAVPFALFDALCIGVVVWLVWCAVADVRGRRRTGAVRALFRTLQRVVVTTAVLYLAFLACWGLNYRRVPIAEKFAVDSAKVTPRRARELAATAVERVNALYADAHAESRETFDPAPLAQAFAEAERELRVSRGARPARPKHSLLDWYFRSAGVDGMTDPYFLETLVVSGLFPFERPFIVAHEWSHLAGFADESEANLAGWLACVHGTSEAQYSGWLFLYTEIGGSLRRADLIQVSARLGDGPRADLRAVSERFRRQRNVAVSNAGWRVYDQYLKANRVEAGTASYAEVVRLVLGMSFDEQWTIRKN
jgi:hypothetical protein